MGGWSGREAGGGEGIGKRRGGRGGDFVGREEKEREKEKEEEEEESMCLPNARLGLQNPRSDREIWQGQSNWDNYYLKICYLQFVIASSAYSRLFLSFIAV